MTRIWERASNQGGDASPPVIPIVLYNGTVAWNVPRNFAALYQAPESLREVLCDFSYYLCDLSAYADEEIKLGALLTVALRLMKNIYRRDLGQRLLDMISLLRAMPQQSALEFLESILAYLGAASATVTMKECRSAVETTFPKTGGEFMNRWIEQIEAERRREWLREGLEEGWKEGMKEGLKEGMKEGKIEGMKEGAASLTIRLLARKFGGLDAALEERIRHLTLEQVERLCEELLDFPDASALTEWLDTHGRSRRRD